MNPFPCSRKKSRQTDSRQQALRLRGKCLRLWAYLLAVLLLLGGLVLSLREPQETLGLLLTECSIFPALLAYLHFLGEPRRLEQARRRQLGLVQLPFVAADFRGKDPSHMQKLYARLGFAHISLLPLQEPGHPTGSVAAITVGGKPPREGQWYDPQNEMVMIYCLQDQDPSSGEKVD